MNVRKIGKNNSDIIHCTGTPPFRTESCPYHEEPRLETSFYPFLPALKSLFLHCSSMVTLTSLPALSLQHTELELYSGRKYGLLNNRYFTQCDTIMSDGVAYALKVHAVVLQTTWPVSMKHDSQSYDTFALAQFFTDWTRSPADADKPTRRI